MSACVGVTMALNSTSVAGPSSPWAVGIRAGRVDTESVPTRNLFIYLLAATLLVLLPARTSARVVIDQTGRRVNVPDHPHRLVSLAPNITETIFALGLGDELVGDTDNCNSPPQAQSKPHVGPMVNPSLERIVALKPDLVFGYSGS